MFGIPNFVWISVLVVASIFLVLFVLSLVRGSFLNHQLFKPPQKVPELAERQDIQFLAITDSWLGFKSTIPCRLVMTKDKNPIENRNLIVYSYGSNESIACSADTVDQLSREIDTDYLSYDYPGYGEDRERRPFEMSERGFNRCLRLIVQAMIDRGYKPEHIVLHGFSMGTGPSTAAAAHFSRSKYKLGGLVLQSPFSSIRQGIRDVMSPWLAYTVPDRWNNEKAIKDVTFSILILHGSADDNVPFVNSERIQSSNKKANLIKFENVGHYIPVTLVSREIKKWLRTRN